MSECVVTYWPLRWRNDNGELRLFEFESEGARLLTALMMADSPDIYEVTFLDAVELPYDPGVRERIWARLQALTATASVESAIREAAGR